MSDYSRTTIYKTTASRTRPLTATMAGALDQIRTRREVFAGNDIALPTVQALATAGEILLQTTHHWGSTYPRHRAYSYLDWTAYPAPAAGTEIRVIRRSMLTTLHLGCPCLLRDGEELHATFRAEQLHQAAAEAERVAHPMRPVSICAKQDPAPARQLAPSAAASPATRPATPLVALARTLRGLGLTQGRGKDFRITGAYRRGERTETYALLLTRRAEDLAAEHADRIEAETSAAGYPFRVSIYRTGAGPVCTITNRPGDSVRETAAPADTAAVVGAISAAARALHTAGAPAAEPATAPVEPVLADRHGAPLARNARVLVHGSSGHPLRGIVGGWTPEGALLVCAAGGRTLTVTAPADVEAVSSDVLAGAGPAR